MLGSSIESPGNPSDTAIEQTLANLGRLNDKFGDGDRMHFNIGRGGLIKCNMRHFDGSSIEIYLLGANITSWNNAGERYFVGGDASFEIGKPIDSGVPVVFPQFCRDLGMPDFHGNSRSREWQPVMTTVGDYVTGIQFRLEPNAESLLAPNGMGGAISYEIQLRDNGLHTRIVVEGPAKFQLALHDYFLVSDIKNVQISGLKGVSYLDKLRNRQLFQEDREYVTIAENVDRVYANVPSNIILADGTSRGLKIETKGLPDIVVWNPWGPETGGAYRNFICVESGAIFNPIELQDGQIKSFTRSLTCI